MWAKAGVIIATLGGGAASIAGAGDILLVEGRPAELAVVAPGERWDDSWPIETAMGRQLAGVYARYEGRDMDPLRRCVTGRQLPATALAGAERVAIIHLWAGKDRRRLEVLRLPQGSVVARDLGASDATASMLTTAAFHQLEDEWPDYRGTFDAPSDPVGEPFVLDRPYTAARTTMDRGTMKREIYRRQRVELQDADRDLGRERFHVRLPAGYHPRRAAGLVVWASPSASGQIPPAFEGALDELHMICIGVDDTGNDRDVPDKFQLMLDAVATAKARFHVDRTRVYLVGLSGGGKVASILTVCFPDTFGGALCIVGFASYHELAESWGEHRQSYYTKPKGIRLKTARSRRLAAITGPGDFNYREMIERTTWMREDGWTNVMLFDCPELAHELPSPTRFTEALNWADGPARLDREKGEASARQLLAEYQADRKKLRPRNDEDRRMLARIADDGPWTEPGWAAIEALKK